MKLRLLGILLCVVMLATLVGAAPASAAGGPPIYVVKRGDTLSRIALVYHTTVQALVNANHIANPRLIYVGQVLRIPGPAWCPPPPRHMRLYTVQWGDTLLRIARRFGISWQSIASANGLANPNRIFAGQHLWIP